MELKNIVIKYLNFKKYLVKQRTYLYYLQINDMYISKYIGKITVEQLNIFILELKEKYSFSTIKTIKNLINSSLKFAYENKLIDNKIESNIKLKYQNKRKICEIETHEQNILEKYILLNKKYYHYGIIIALYTGLRLGELLSLKWQDVDLKNKFIYVNSTLCSIIQNHNFVLIEDSPKSLSSVREIPICNLILQILKELKSKSNCEYVISSRKNTKVIPRTYQKSFENLLNKLKIKHYGFHALRHTFATIAIECGVDVKTLSEILGHKNPTITLKRYTHSMLKHKQKMMENISKML